jgi:hypothetical protein
VKTIKLSDVGWVLNDATKSPLEKFRVVTYSLCLASPSAAERQDDERHLFEAFKVFLDWCIEARDSLGFEPMALSCMLVLLKAGVLGRLDTLTHDGRYK